MRRHRFHVSDLSGDRVIVTGQEARHALTVLRLTPGDPVVLFDGAGNEAAGLIQSIDKTGMVVAVSSRATQPSSRRHELVLASAMPKGARADWLVEKCAELGVAELQPIAFARSVADPGMAKFERWGRLATAAAKQCGAVHAMKLEAPLGLVEFLARGGWSACTYGSPDAAGTSLIAALTPVLSAGTFPSRIVIVVGPEGGLSPQEVQSLNSAGATAASWASNTLRIETAAVAAAAVFAAMVDAQASP